MASRQSYRGKAVLCAFCSLIITASGTPNIAFPFNSQVPMVARVNQPYLFQFSDSTFAPQTTSFIYSISGEPAWLVIDPASRTLSGTPGDSDAGASTFLLTAADDSGAAHMPCTLVVSTDPAPQIQGDISKQLAVTANLSSSDPPVVTITPSSPFTFSFQQDSFIDIVQRKLYYYATLTDHTPLPSWLNFDPQQLTFSGTAPILSAMPQSWEVELAASDVVGFAGTMASFTIAIGLQQLAFVHPQQNITISDGMAFNFTLLQSQLLQNGTPVSLSNVTNAQASGLPPWLKFDPGDLALSGIVPFDAGNVSIMVTVTDTSDSSATAVVNLVSDSVSLFNSTIKPLSAYLGQVFTYQFPSSLFSESDLKLSVTLPITATWLDFHSDTRVLEGRVPAQMAPTRIEAALMARSSTLPTEQLQPFVIDVKSERSSSNPTRLSTRASPSNRSTSTSLPIPLKQEAGKRLSGGIIAAIVILSLIALIFSLACLLLCLRRRRRVGYERHSVSPAKKKTISRPILLQEPNDTIQVTTDVHTDVEKNARAQPVGNDDLAPQIALNIPSHTNSKRRSRWFNRLSNISKASSIGNGEAAIRSDINIPERGGESAVLHIPHDSFSVPTEMARVSRQLSQTTPTKCALQPLRENRRSRQSVGLGINIGSTLMQRHSSRRSRGHKRGVSSLGLSAAMDRSSQISMSTRGTSVLSTRPSDFPRPPTQSTFTESRSIPTLSITDADKRRSIRLVGRSDSIKDERPMAEKRQSFIRQRASTSLQSPLFSHGSRASSNTRQNEQSSTGSDRHSRRGKSMLVSYSESSSLEPQGRNSRRLSSRIRSTSGPDFPRPITRSSLGANDEGVADESGSGFETTSSSISERDLLTETDRISEHDWREEIHRPRHERKWVLPGEASPTPPPVPPTSRQASSSARHSTSVSGSESSRQKWRDRLADRTPSPLSTAIAVPVTSRNSIAAKAKLGEATKRRVSEPIGLASNDSFSRAEKERPRLVHANSKRPVSVEEVKRLSSLKAETEHDMDTLAGSERKESVEHGTELDGSGLVPVSAEDSKANTQRSNLSGPAFL